MLRMLFFMSVIFVPTVISIDLDYLLGREDVNEQKLKPKDPVIEARRSGQDIIGNKSDAVNLEEELYDLKHLFKKLRPSLRSNQTTQERRKVKKHKITKVVLSKLKPTEANLNIHTLHDYDIDTEQEENQQLETIVVGYEYEYEEFSPQPDEVPSTHNRETSPQRPAKHNFEKKIDFKNNRNNSVWYVPEEYPCWDLPLLYGEFGQKSQNDEVFMVFPPELTNVQQTKNFNNNSYTTTCSTEQTTMSQVIDNDSKWCKMEPCYADHTLCLFSSKANAKICDKHYKVETPNVKNQVAIVNTINSMRNRVAIGKTISYAHLPTASNMQQIVYDYDLQTIAKRWLMQCLPGPPICSALNNVLVTELECTKLTDHCCGGSVTFTGDCSPLQECFLYPIIGCIHTWFESAGRLLDSKDISCGHINRYTYSTAQLLWATTTAVGCAYAIKPSGNIRVACEFSPGAPFFLHTRVQCGILPSRDITPGFDILSEDITNISFVKQYGLKLIEKSGGISNIVPATYYNNLSDICSDNIYWGMDTLYKIYEPGWGRQFRKNKYKNGTKAFIAKLVTQYTFFKYDDSLCASGESIYEFGPPGSDCLETGRNYPALCYNFRDPSPVYRLVAVLAPVALFTLILYDLFSGVVKQTNF